MISVQESLIKLVKQTTLVHSATFNSNTIDIFNLSGAATKCLIFVAIGTTDGIFTALKLQGSDTNSGSDWADVSGSILGTDVDVNGNVSTLPDASADNTIIGWTVNTNSGAYRYYRVVATVDATGSGANIGIYALLGNRGNVALTQDIATGCAQLLCVPPVIPATH